MIRTMIAFGIAATLLAYSAPSTFAKTMQPSASGGLGNTRGDFIHAYGNPKRDFFTDDVGKAIHIDTASFENKKDETRLDVNFLVNKDNHERPTDRAMDIVIYPPSGSDWTLTQANDAVLALLPKDAAPLGDLAPVQSNVQLTFDLEAQIYSSASLAKAIPDTTWWTVDGTVGHFGVVIQQDMNGSYSGISFGTDARA